MKNLTKALSVGIFILSLVFLLLYSFTQIDLGLALTRFEGLHAVQRVFQEIGYFQRGASAGIFIFVISFLCISYLFILRLLYRGLMRTKDVITLSIVSSVILFLSYNAFSYDLFNYIFDAKIVTYYHENPYEKKALDFPEDPMLGFMHWTHRVYPYGPVWLGATVPLSYLSTNSLIASIFLFKALAVASYLGSVFVLRKIVSNLDLAKPQFHLGLFALNPLVLTESLVSAHNDIFMIFLALLAFYCLMLRKRALSFMALLLSAGVKFATALLLPVFAYVYLKKGSIDWQRVITYSFIAMALAVIIATLRTNFQPWYLLYILPFAALSKKTLVVIPSITLSILAFLQYLPYIYLGNYDAPIPLVMAAFLSASLLSGALFLALIYILKKGKDLS